MQNIHEQIWASALRMIEIRPHSQGELKKKLREKFDEAEEIQRVIEEMKRLHLLNDQLFTEQFISHLTQKNVGRLKIMYEAQKRGLKSDMVEQALLSVEWSEEASAKKAIQEKERVLGGIDERKKDQKLMNFLRNRGFSDRVIYRVLRSEE